MDDAIWALLKNGVKKTGHFFLKPICITCSPTPFTFPMRCKASVWGKEWEDEVGFATMAFIDALISMEYIWLGSLSESPGLPSSQAEYVMAAGPSPDIGSWEKKRWASLPALSPLRPYCYGTLIQTRDGPSVQSRGRSWMSSPCLWTIKCQVRGKGGIWFISMAGNCPKSYALRRGPQGPKLFSRSPRHKNRAWVPSGLKL